MPYPTNATAFPEAVKIFQSPDDFIPEPAYVVVADEDDDYWNLYGQHDDDPAFKPAAKPHTPLTENDYWAQYSTVHGSADSTIPSPAPEKRSLPPLQTERVFVASDSLQPSATELYNPHEPPSPERLAERLAELSVRPASPPLQDEEESVDSSIPSPHNQPSELGLSELSLDTPPSAGPADESNAALHLTIQGIYRLWKSEQMLRNANPGPEAFLALVRTAIQ